MNHALNTPAPEALNPFHQAHPLSAETFSLYGRPFEGIAGGELVNTDDIVARLEGSGSEGIYIEVARWDDTEKRWARFAFLKEFDINKALALTEQINKTNGYAPVFHALPDYTTPQAQ